MGYAVMMQGRYINHAALNAYHAPERVTMVSLSSATSRLTVLHMWAEMLHHLRHVNR